MDRPGRPPPDWGPGIRHNLPGLVRVPLRRKSLVVAGILHDNRRSPGDVIIRSETAQPVARSAVGAEIRSPTAWIAADAANAGGGAPRPGAPSANPLGS